MPFSTCTIYGVHRFCGSHQSTKLWVIAWDLDDLSVQQPMAAAVSSGTRSDENNDLEKLVKVN